MAAKSERQINSFIKGLITESNPLTYPENASLDEDNFVLNRDGSRSRRLGIDYEEDYVLRSLGTSTTERISFHEWRISGGTADKFIGVVRVYNQLWFFNMLDRSPSSAILNGGLSVTIPFLENSEMDSAVINNALIIVSADIPYPVRLTYNNETDSVSYEQYNVLVRDFWGVYDGLLENERPTVLSNVHKYNLMNQGWTPTVQTTCGTEPIVCTYTTIGKYPSNSDVWTLGKVEDTASTHYEKYSATELVKRNHDFMIAPKGKHVIDVFNRGASRQEVSTVVVASTPVNGSTSGQSLWETIRNQVTFTANVAAAAAAPVDTSQNLPIDREAGAFTAIAAFAGRVFYSGVRTSVVDPDVKSPNYSGYIFFTQTVTSDEKLARCYQDADPTSPDISDIIDTDGGAIQITEASNIVALIPTKSMLLVFAENGVWQISGGQQNFSATEYEVYKISSIGCKNKKSIIAVNNEVYYWAKGGIFRIVFDDTDGGLKGENLSLTSIQTLYNDIPDIAKEHARGIFEEKQNQIRWLYNNSAAYAGESKYNRELILDLTLGAFYTNTIDMSSVYIADFVKIPDYAESQTVDEVVVGTDPVLVTSLDEVVVSATDTSSRESQYNYLAVNASNQFTLARYRNTTFLDWVTATGGINYTSYLVTGYDIFGEIMRKKYVPYIMFYFDRTEDGYVDVGGNLELANQSSCLVQAQWNWTNSANSGKWGTSFQAYRLTRNYIPSGVADTFDYGDRVIVTKNRLRGSGRAISLKIQSEQGKDMKLLGWALTVTGNSIP